MTREEAIKWLKLLKSSPLIYGEYPEALDMAIEALSEETSTIQEKHQLSEKTPTDRPTKPTNIPTEPTTEARNREPSEDGTLEVKVEDATKVGRVLISDDKHRGGLYYPDEDEPQGDLISRAEAIEALGEEPPVWCDEEYEIAEHNQWREDVEAIKSVPSADRPKGKWIYWREDGIKRCKCSRCLTSYGCLDTPYCPNCGEKMVEGRSEE